MIFNSRYGWQECWSIGSWSTSLTQSVWWPGRLVIVKEPGRDSCARWDGRLGEGWGNLEFCQSELGNQHYESWPKLLKNLNLIVIMVIKIHPYKNDKHP